MRVTSELSAGLCIILAISGCLCVRSTAQEARGGEAKGLPPRASPADYQAQAQARPIMIAADFDGHSVPTADGTYNTKDFVVVEVALFGAPGAKAKLASGDFSLRIGKKGALPSQPYELVRRSLEDPEWSPPKQEKPKTSFGGDGGNTGPAAPVHMPMDLRLAMEQRVRAAVLLEGERTLPQAGLLFFEYRGKTDNLGRVELIYNGPTGTATLALQP